MGNGSEPSQSWMCLRERVWDGRIMKNLSYAQPKGSGGRSDVRLPTITELGAPMDLRKSRRYPLSAPAFFCWERSDGMLQDGKGETRDISTTGAFIVTDTAPPW